MILALSWRNIWRNKRRSFLTMGSVFFAVIFSTLLNGVKEGMYAQMKENTIYAFTGYVQVQDAEYKEERSIDYALTYDDSLINRIKSHDHVLDVVPRIQQFSLASVGDLLKAVTVFGIDPEKEKEHYHLDERLIKGTYLKEHDDGILLAKGLAERLQINVGDTLVLLGMGYHGANAAGKYPVKGIIRPYNPEYNKSGIYMTLEGMQYYLAAPTIATGLLVMIDKEKNKDDVQRALAIDLNTHYKVYSWPMLVPEFEKMIEADRVEGYIFMGIMYFIVTFVIFGTIVMLLAERTREFAIMLAVGMHRAKIGLSLILEIIFTNILGAMAGLIAAYLTLWYFHEFPISFGDDLGTMMEEYGFEPIISTSTDISIAIRQTVIVFGIATILSLYAFYELIRLNLIKIITTR